MSRIYDLKNQPVKRVERNRKNKLNRYCLRFEFLTVNKYYQTEYKWRGLIQIRQEGKFDLKSNRAVFRELLLKQTSYFINKSIFNVNDNSMQFLKAWMQRY